MQINDELLLETTIGKRQGAPKVFQIRLGDFPPAAIEKFLRYGFQRVFNDAVGGSDETLETKVAEVEAMIARFKAGEIGRKARENVDPLMHECRLIVSSLLRKQNPAAWKKIKGREDKNAVLDRLTSDEIKGLAQEEIKKKAAAEKKLGGISLGSLEV